MRHVVPIGQVIVAQHPDLGTGFFTGFQDGSPYFQSVLDKRVKVYRNIRNAGKQLARIKQGSPDDPATYEIQSTIALERRTECAL